MTQQRPMPDPYECAEKIAKYLTGPILQYSDQRWFKYYCDYAHHAFSSCSTLIATHLIQALSSNEYNPIHLKTILYFIDFILKNDQRYQAEIIPQLPAAFLYAYQRITNAKLLHNSIIDTGEIQQITTILTKFESTLGTWEYFFTPDKIIEMKQSISQIGYDYEQQRQQQEQQSTHVRQALAEQGFTSTNDTIMDQSDNQSSSIISTDYSNNDDNIDYQSAIDSSLFEQNPTTNMNDEYQQQQLSSQHQQQPQQQQNTKIDQQDQKRSRYQTISNYDAHDQVMLSSTNSSNDDWSLPASVLGLNSTTTTNNEAFSHFFFHKRQPFPTIETSNSLNKIISLEYTHKLINTVQHQPTPLPTRYQGTPYSTNMNYNYFDPNTYSDKFASNDHTNANFSTKHLISFQQSSIELLTNCSNICDTCGLQLQNERLYRIHLNSHVVHHNTRQRQREQILLVTQLQNPSGLLDVNNPHIQLDEYGEPIEQSDQTNTTTTTTTTTTGDEVKLEDGTQSNSKQEENPLEYTQRSRAWYLDGDVWPMYRSVCGTVPMCINTHPTHNNSHPMFAQQNLDQINDYLDHLKVEQTTIGPSYYPTTNRTSINQEQQTNQDFHSTSFNANQPYIDVKAEMDDLLASFSDQPVQSTNPTTSTSTTTTSNEQIDWSQLDLLSTATTTPHLEQP